MINNSSTQSLDLRGVPCPANFIRCRLFIEQLEPNNSFYLELDRGEAEDNVISGLTEAGHNIEILFTESKWVRLKVTCVAS